MLKYLASVYPSILNATVLFAPYVSGFFLFFTQQAYSHLGIFVFPIPSQTLLLPVSHYELFLSHYECLLTI